MPLCLHQGCFYFRFSRILGHVPHGNHVLSETFADKDVKKYMVEQRPPKFGFDLSSSYADYRSRAEISF